MAVRALQSHAVSPDMIEPVYTSQGRAPTGRSLLQGGCKGSKVQEVGVLIVGRSGRRLRRRRLLLNKQKHRMQIGDSGKGAYESEIAKAMRRGRVTQEEGLEFSRSQLVHHVNGPFDLFFD